MLIRPNSSGVEANRHTGFTEEVIENNLAQNAVLDSSDDESSTAARILTSLFKTFLLTLLGFLTVHLLVSHTQLLNSTPVYSDDYDFLASTFTHLKWSCFRPLSTFVWSLGAAFGGKTLFVLTELITVAYLSLSIFYVKTLFNQNIYSGFADYLTTYIAAVLASSFESLVQHFYFAGTLQNMMAGCFALAAYLLFLTGQNRRHTPVSLTAPAIVFLISVLSKEDFVLATGVFYLFFAVCAPVSGRKWARMLLGAAITTVIGVVLYQKYGISSQFFSGASQHYAMQFAPLSILTVYWKYLTVSPGSIIAGLVQITATAYMMMRGKGDERLRALLLNVQILALIAPFSLLPNHFIEYFAFNWICWQMSMISIFARDWTTSSSGQRFAIVALLVATAAGTVALTEKGRGDLSKWFGQKAAINSNAIETLKHYRPELENARSVAVIDPPALGPWTANSGQFLSQKLQFHNEWLLYSKRGSEFQTLNQSFSTQKHGTMKFNVYESSPPLSEIPTLKFNEDGSGVLSGKN